MSLPSSSVSAFGCQRRILSFGHFAIFVCGSGDQPLGPCPAPARVLIYRAQLATNLRPSCLCLLRDGGILPPSVETGDRIECMSQFSGGLSWEAPQWEPIVALWLRSILRLSCMSSQPWLCCPAYCPRPVVPRGSMFPLQEADKD